MQYMLYFIYNKEAENGKTPICVYTQQLSENYGRKLLGVATCDDGLKKFFADIWWGADKRHKGVYLSETDGVDEELEGELEKILSPKIEMRKFHGTPSKEALQKRKPRKTNYIYCVPGLVPDWVDANYSTPSEILERRLNL